jgi:hypothetical protein
VLNEKCVVGLLLDGARDALSVLRAKLEGPQDQQIQGALQEGDSRSFVVSGRHST